MDNCTWCVTEEFSEPITYAEYIDSIRREAEIMKKAKLEKQRQEQEAWERLIKDDTD